MEIRNINRFKKQLCLIFAALLISCFTGCKKDNSSDNNNSYLVKAKISNANLLFNTEKTASQQNYSSNFDPNTLLMQNKSGQIEPVYFITENGDSITMNIGKFRKLSDEYLLLSGDFQLRDGYFSNVLVNTLTENLYGFPGDYNEYYWLWESTTVENDKKGNLYFSDSNMIYKIDISSISKITIEKYLPQNQQPSGFMVNPDGVCFYYTGNSNANPKFKLPSGSIVPFSHLFGDDSSGSGIFGFDGSYYGNIMDSGAGFKLYRIDFDDIEPKETLIIKDRGELHLHKNHIKKTYFAFTTEGKYPGPYTPIIIEIDGTHDKETIYPLTNTIAANGSGTTANYFVLTNTKENMLTKISLLDYNISTVNLGEKSEYEFYDIKYDINSDIISFTGLRYRDSRNIIGSIDGNNNISMDVVEQGKPINLVKLN